MIAGFSLLNGVFAPKSYFTEYVHSYIGSLHLRELEYLGVSNDKFNLHADVVNIGKDMKIAVVESEAELKRRGK